MGVSEGAMRNKDLQGMMRGGSWDGSSGREGGGVCSGAGDVLQHAGTSACFFNSKVETWNNWQKRRV